MHQLSFVNMRHATTPIGKSQPWRTPQTPQDSSPSRGSQGPQGCWVSFDLLSVDLFTLLLQKFVAGLEHSLWRKMGLISLAALIALTLARRVDNQNLSALDELLLRDGAADALGHGDPAASGMGEV